MARRTKVINEMKERKEDRKKVRDNIENGGIVRKK
jgi:hypothetical protein